MLQAGSRRAEGELGDTSEKVHDAVFLDDAFALLAQRPWGDSVRSVG